MPTALSALTSALTMEDTSVRDSRLVARSWTRFTLVLIGVLAALVGVQIIEVQAARSVQRAGEAQVAMSRDVELIRYYDELLTMSARLATVTGDQSYVARYHDALPKLDRVIADARSLVPDSAADDALRATYRANRDLIQLEEDAFRRLAAGDRAGAYRTVSSPTYTALKNDYRGGMDLAVRRMQLVAERSRADAARLQLLSLAGGLGAAVALALMWGITAHGLHRAHHSRGRVEAQLRQQAQADPLTGLANRRLFRERLSTALAGPGAGEVAVLFADLDHFKTVNDTLGHNDGDALLIEVAERLVDLLHGHPGALIARLGGDEFAVLLPRAHGSASEQLAGRIVAGLSQPYAVAPQVPVTASVGIAIGTPAQLDPGIVLRGADLAMYEAKSAGRAQWRRYADHMYTDLLNRVELESQLREGLHRGELVLHYQPITELSTGARHGFEALVRWQHPEHGLLPPGAFVPLAEAGGLIVDLGRFVLEQGCRQLARWLAEQGEKAPRYVSVNVSPQELNQDGYARQVLDVLQVTGLPARSLVIEVTESTVMMETGDVVGVLTHLRRTGVRIAIDDFGTGHSSLARLHALPVDMIKIDRSFVHAAAPSSTEPADATTLNLIVELARRLGLEVVAEGIETTRQLDIVRDVGCSYGQGYLLGRPGPATPPTKSPLPTKTAMH